MQSLDECKAPWQSMRRSNHHFHGVVSKRQNAALRGSASRERGGSRFQQSLSVNEKAEYNSF